MILNEINMATFTQSSNSPLPKERERKGPKVEPSERSRSREIVGRIDVFHERNISTTLDKLKEGTEMLEE